MKIVCCFLIHDKKATIPLFVKVNQFLNHVVANNALPKLHTFLQFPFWMIQHLLLTVGKFIIVSKLEMLCGLLFLECRLSNP